MKTSLTHWPAGRYILMIVRVILYPGDALNEMLVLVKLAQPRLFCDHGGRTFQMCR